MTPFCSLKGGEFQDTRMVFEDVATIWKSVGGLLGPANKQNPEVTNFVI